MNQMIVYSASLSSTTIFFNRMWRRVDCLCLFIKVFTSVTVTKITCTPYIHLANASATSAATPEQHSIPRRHPTTMPWAQVRVLSFRLCRIPCLPLANCVVCSWCNEQFAHLLSKCSKWRCDGCKVPNSNWIFLTASYCGAWSANLTNPARCGTPQTFTLFKSIESAQVTLK